MSQLVDEDHHPQHDNHGENVSDYDVKHGFPLLVHKIPAVLVLISCYQLLSALAAVAVLFQDVLYCVERASGNGVQQILH
jgi:hypothetical protein